MTTAVAVKTTALATGVAAYEQDGHLIICIPMSGNQGVSKTGKMRVVGQTGGFKAMNTSSGRALVNVSVYLPKE